MPIWGEGLVKTYGEVRALDGLAVRVLTTLRRADSGSATVAGLDVVRAANALCPIIGLSGQYAAVDENLTGFENLDMVGRLYHRVPHDRHRRCAPAGGRPIDVPNVDVDLGSRPGGGVLHPAATPPGQDRVRATCFRGV